MRSSAFGTFGSTRTGELCCLRWQLGSDTCQQWTGDQGFGPLSCDARELPDLSRGRQRPVKPGLPQKLATKAVTSQAGFAQKLVPQGLSPSITDRNLRLPGISHEGDGKAVGAACCAGPVTGLGL